jgi:hypothetical protein
MFHQKSVQLLAQLTSEFIPQNETLLARQLSENLLEILEKIIVVEFGSF